MAERNRVLILGAGSAGLTAAMAMQRAARSVPGLEVTLLDQFNYHLFQPLLYQVATGGVEPGHICFTVRSLLDGGGNTTPIIFRESRAHDIDVDRKTVTTDHGVLEWDYLVVALGATTNFFGLPGAGDNALPLKSLADGISIHNRIIERYEAALREPDEQCRRQLLTFVVVGAGATGVELVASVEGFVSKVLVRDFPSLAPFAKVVLIEGQDRVLSGMKTGVSNVALRRLLARGVDVRLNTRVTGVWPDRVTTDNGAAIPTATVIWLAGVTPIDVAAALPFDKARDGRFNVSPSLEVPGSSGVYITGDCAYLPQPFAPEPYPPTGQIAVRQGLACAHNIISAVTGRPQVPFRYRYKGELISMGRNVAVAQIGRFAFDGLPAWLLWRTYYLGKLMGFRSKLGVATDWSMAYFYRSNTARLE